jgi:thiol-disulfide isomerase/thioredoxin
MKKFLFIIFLFSFLLVNAQENSNINGNLIGYLKKTDFLNGKHKNWFSKNYDNYTPDPKIVHKIKKKLNNISIKSFIGSWCHDSKRELPRFYKIMELTGFDLENNFKMIGITIGKKTPTNLQKGFTIKYTPTFIFFRDGKEIGRFVEHSKKTIEKDILKILRGGNYKHPYQK